MKRLQGALENAGRTTKQIADIVREAEELAARLLGAVTAAASWSASRDQASQGAGGGSAPAEQTPAQAAEA
jgi:hypothetical protein